MKDDKGFTLIELLAVILILGIIALVAVSTVNNSIKTAKIESGGISVGEIVRAFETKKIENEVSTKSELQAGYYIKSDLENLNISSVKNFDNILIEFGEDGFVKTGTFCVNGLSYSYDGNSAVYQEYADFCNGKNNANTSNAKLSNGGYILDEEGNLYAIGTHKYLKYVDGVDGKAIIDKYKKVDTNGKKFKKFTSDGSSEYAGIDMNNKLYVWGNGGTIGLADKGWATVDKPTLVSDAIEFKDVEMGYNNSIGLDTSGQLYTWGYSASGFGEGRIKEETPAKILEGVEIVSIATASYDAYLALDTNGDIYIWGHDYPGYAGDGTQDKTYNTPAKVLTGYNFKKLYSGLISKSQSWGAIYAIDANGDLWGWGENRGEVKEYDGRQYIPTPYKITDNVKKVVADYGKLAILKNDNSLYISGGPKKMIDGEFSGLLKYQNNVKDVSLYSGAVYYLDMNDNIYSFGSNDNSALGIGASAYYYTPTKTDINIRDFSIYGYSIKNNMLYAFNYSTNKYEYVKDATNIQKVFQTKGGYYILKTDKTIEELKCYDGYRSTCDYFNYYVANKKFDYVNDDDSSVIILIDNKGNLYTSGSYYFKNNLGHTANANYYYFSQLLSTSKKQFTKALLNSAGFALTTDNILYGWGDNSYGQLANGNKTDQVTPIKISDGVTDYYVSYSNLFVINSNNDLYYSGKINGLLEESTTLKKIDSDIKFSKIYTDTVFGDTDGHIYGYGDNSSGELGIGNINKLNEFTRLLGGKKVRAVYDFNSAYYYITENNELYVAGSDSKGLLGLGNKNLTQSTYKLLMKNVDSIYNTCGIGTYCNNYGTTIINTLSGETYMLGDNKTEKDTIISTNPIAIKLYN